MHKILDWFWGMSPLDAFGWMLVVNLLLFAAALAAGHLAVKLFLARRVTEPPPPLEAREIWLAAMCVFLNSVVTIGGWFLWKAGILTVRRDVGLRAWLDAAVLLIAMDFLMYLFHRVAHLPWLYPILHRTHHLYDRPRPISLFVLSPFEVLGFGALWLSLLCVYPSSWLGMVVYLTLNLAFGTIGHLGVEPFPRAWAKWPILRHIGTSTFHAEHHLDGRSNYGFYTDIWDRLFRTLDRRYASLFGQIHPTALAPEQSSDAAV